MRIRPTHRQQPTVRSQGAPGAHAGIDPQHRAQGVGAKPLEINQKLPDRSRAPLGPALSGLAWTLTLALAGCAPKQGEAQIYGSLILDACKDGEGARWTCPVPASAPCAAFKIEADSLSVETFGDRAVVRLQHGGRPQAQSDSLAFDIRDVAAVRAQLGEPIALSDAGIVRGALALFDRCPESLASLRLDGAVVFEAFGTQTGDRVAGRFDNLLVVDRRDPEAPPLGTLSGSFDFDVVKGTIHQRFVDR